jgi:hypothetical protein
MLRTYSLLFYACYASICVNRGAGMKSAVLNSVSDSIRNHVTEVYLKPAIRKGERIFTVNVGAVHKALGLINRVPQVCSALESKKLLEENHLQVISKNGPPSGQSTTVTFTYEILAQERGVPAVENPLAELRGLAKDIFRKLGGGEAFIRNERSSFNEHGDKSH